MPQFTELFIPHQALTPTHTGKARLSRAAVLVGLAALASPALACAQSTSSGHRDGARSEHAVLGQPSVITGIVRDPHGVPLVGAIVELLDGAAAVRAGAVTDLHGRYLVANLLPGRYQLRATATLAAPVTHKLQLRSGAKAVVDLTVGTLFDSTSWLPAERRRVDDPDDDWKWTLRSTANRPILRDLSPGRSAPGEHPSSNPPIRVRAAVAQTSGKFAQSGLRETLTTELQHGETGRSAVRADVITSPAHSGQPTSYSVAFADERRLGPATVVRTSASHTVSSGLLGPAGSTSVSSLQLTSAEQMTLGDLVEIEAGSRLLAVGQNGASAVQTLPFLHILAHPAERWTASYSLATARDLRDVADMGPWAPDVPTVTRVQGRLRSERGLHQRVSINHALHRSSIEAALYHDRLDRVAISGIQTSGFGELRPPEASAAAQVASEAGSLLFGPQMTGFLLDRSTGVFRVVAPGYTASGWDVAWTEDISSDLRVTVAYSSGAALALTSGNNSTKATATPASRGSDHITRATAEAATLAVKANLRGSGTKLRAAYRWQPERLVTPVDTYNLSATEAYFGMHLRQPVPSSYLGTHEVEISADAVNLLAQGYRRVMSATPAQACYLTSAPRTLQAGLSFIF